MKPARILVVDDEPGIRQSLCGVLGDEGHLARAVASGEECLEELAREPSELVLLDVWLPGLDGMDTLTRIQELHLRDNRFAEVPDALRALTRLAYLDLRGNPFTELPAWLQDLPSLIKLDLRWHGLTAIPDWLPSLEASGCRVLL